MVILKSKKNSGFTLLELLIVIAVIGILAGVIIASVNKARASARNAVREKNIDQIYLALNMFYGEHGCLPRTNASTCISGYKENNKGGWDSSIVGDFMPFLVTDGKMSEVPKDPLNDSEYYYRYFCYPSGVNKGLALYYYFESPKQSIIFRDHDMLCK